MFGGEETLSLSFLRSCDVKYCEERFDLWLGGEGGGMLSCYHLQRQSWHVAGITALCERPEENTPAQLHIHHR